MTNLAISGYITLEQAVGAVGRQLMPREWLGQEVNLLKVDSRATEEVGIVGEKATATDTALGRLNRAVNYLLRALFAGDVKVVAAREGGDLRDFPAALWKRPGIRAVFRSGELPVNFRVAIEGHRADAGTRWILVSELDIHRLLSGRAAGPEVTDVEGEFRAWLATKINERAQEKPLRKKQTWTEAQSAFGSRLPYHSFERIWTATVPEAWRRPIRAGRAKAADRRGFVPKST